jgi:hypothetical protein
MVEEQIGLFTVGVFQDAAWASRALDALKDANIPAEALSVLAKDGADAAALIEKALGAVARADVAVLGPVVHRGSLVDVLQGNAGDLTAHGLSGTMRRVGFQAHDARIFEALVLRGGVLVAARGEPRAADALAIMLSYGGGNSAIGAWAGRV